MNDLLATSRHGEACFNPLWEHGVTWHGHIFLERGWLLYDGPIAATSAHAHHAFQIILASEPAVELVSDTERARVDVAAIPADEPHGFASPAVRAVILYVEPESRAGRHVRTRLDSTTAISSWVEIAAPLRGIVGPTVERWEEARRIHDAVLDRLVPPDQRARPWPPVIQRMVALLPTRLDGELRLGKLAQELGLSESRLAHLISEYLGIPFRSYVLWLRLERAAADMACGRTLTEAAHHAGFSDGAHLSRVFRRMFGIAPSELAGFARWHVASS